MGKHPRQPASGSCTGQAAFRRPVRTLLLLQGTVWGVAVAVFPSAVIQGTQEAARVRGASLGADRISVVADPTAEGSRPLMLTDVNALSETFAREDVPLIALGGARILSFPSTSHDDADRPAVLVGSSGAVPLARGHRLAAGRWLAAGDDGDACVVEADVAAWLGREALVPGDTFRLPEKLHNINSFN